MPYASQLAGDTSASHHPRHVQGFRPRPGRGSTTRMFIQGASVRGWIGTHEGSPSCARQSHNPTCSRSLAADVKRPPNAQLPSRSRSDAQAATPQVVCARSPKHFLRIERPAHSARAPPIAVVLASKEEKPMQCPAVHHRLRTRRTARGEVAVVPSGARGPWPRTRERRRRWRT